MIGDFFLISSTSAKYEFGCYNGLLTVLTLFHTFIALFSVGKIVLQANSEDSFGLK